MGSIFLPSETTHCALIDNGRPGIVFIEIGKCMEQSFLTFFGPFYFFCLVQVDLELCCCWGKVGEGAVAASGQEWHRELTHWDLQQSIDSFIICVRLRWHNIPPRVWGTFARAWWKLQGLGLCCGRACLLFLTVVCGHIEILGVDVWLLHHWPVQKHSGWAWLSCGKCCDMLLSWSVFFFCT